MSKHLTLIALALLFVTSSARAQTLDQILDAIRKVETANQPHKGEYARGDGGLARGPFQIHEQYWRDSGVSGRYKDCDRLDYSRRVVLAYWQRYCPQAVKSRDVQTLARIHNGGPGGVRLRATVEYWRRVRQTLKG